MRAPQPSRLTSLFLLAGATILIGAIAVALVVVFRLNRPPATAAVALAPAPKLVITYFPTPTLAVKAPAPTETAMARERELRRVSQAATTVARATAEAAAAAPTRRIGSRAPTLAPPTPQPTPDATPVVATTATATVAPQAASPICRQTEGTVVRELVKSPGLNDTIPVLVALPPCFDPVKYRYPALYLLQGSGDVEGQWERLGLVTRANRLIADGELPPFLIVMPNNDIDLGEASKFLNSAEGPGSWEDFIVNDVVAMVDAKYAGWADPQGRAIGGISRGGYWSLEIAFRNPRVFGTVGGHSPVIAGEYLVGATDDFRMTMMARSPEDLKSLRIWLDVGDNDLYTIAGPDDLAQSLSAIGVKAQFTVGAGAHEDAYWASRVDDYLNFYTAPWFGASPVAVKR